MSQLNFVALGLANCVIRDSENQLQEIQVIEPIPSASLATLVQGIATSYCLVKGFRIDELLDNTQEVIFPTDFPEKAALAQDFKERLLAAARTYQNCDAESLPIQIGQELSLNNPLPQRRVLNQQSIVTDSDNIKQVII